MTMGVIFILSHDKIYKQKMSTFSMKLILLSNMLQVSYFVFTYPTSSYITWVQFKQIHYQYITLKMSTIMW